MSLFGVANFYPRSAPDVRVSRNHVRREFAVEDLCVPLVAYEIDTIRNGDHELRDGTEVDESGELMSDETGLALWPTSTLVVSVLMRCRGVLGSTDVLELGSGSGFCGLVARQIARRVVFSDREFETRELIRRNLRLQPRSDMPASLGMLWLGRGRRKASRALWARCRVRRHLRGTPGMLHVPARAPPLCRPA